MKDLKIFKAVADIPKGADVIVLDGLAFEAMKKGDTYVIKINNGQADDQTDTEAA